MQFLPPPAAETIFHIFSFPVTNTLINSTVAVLIFFAIGLILKNKTALVPGRLQNFSESVFELVLDYVDRVSGSRQRSLKFLPLVAGVFLFILFSNWLGLIPGTGSIGRYIEHNGEVVLIPLLRSANSDLNLTLAMAIF